MLVAIVGDTVGSVYEWDNIKTIEFPLFLERSFFTDDTVMTVVAVDDCTAAVTPIPVSIPVKRLVVMAPSTCRS